MSVQVPEGYKQTEVGVIPDAWNVLTLGEVVTFLDGKRKPVKDTERAKMQGMIPYYGASGIVDYVNDFIFDEELILLGEDGENILSRNCALAFKISGKAWVNNHAHVLRPNLNISIGFLTDYLESLNYERFNSGTAQPKLNKQTCAAILVAIPPTKSEQEAIANALSDADALIESLEQLITKKRQIKQGAMQELLTGQKRLPGYSRDWELKKIGEILSIQHGKSQHGVSDRNGSYPILATGGQIGTANHFLYDKPSVLIGRKGTIDQPRYMDQPFWSVDTLFYSVVKESNSAKFIYYCFCLIDWKQHNEASGVPSLNARTIEALELRVPLLDEQEDIATILTDMDTEITELETKLAKARDVKQGMMQQLLTGRISLI
jgi:type I restriction enzyme S subunit